jgi:hypothetical protein
MIFEDLFKKEKVTNEPRCSERNNKIVGYNLSYQSIKNVILILKDKKMKLSRLFQLCQSLKVIFTPNRIRKKFLISF